MLAQTFGCVRVVYNQALRHRTDSWFERQERVSYAASSARLTELKKTDEFVWLNDVSSVPLQQSLRHLQTGFLNFFAGRTGYPSFKAKHHHRDSAEYTKSAFRWDQVTQQLTLAKMKTPLPIRFSRHVPAEPTTITISRDPSGRYHVSMLVETEVTELDDAPNDAIGIDMGITTFATLSTGEKVANPRYHQADMDRLARAQRDLARKQKGSKNRGKAAQRVARIHARIADRRRDHHHQLSTRLVRENQTIVVEDLNLRGMVTNRHLSRAISDVGWGQFASMCEYKSDWYGRDFVKIDRWFPSTRRCSNCGHIGPKLDLSIRKWDCVECGAHHDRDHNASINIRAAGLAVQACGDGVRPSRNSGDATLVEAGNFRSDSENPTDSSVGRSQLVRKPRVPSPVSVETRTHDLRCGSEGSVDR